MRTPIFSIEDLHVSFETPQGAVEAVRGASLEVKRGELLAVVGESGSGKSQMIMAAMGLLAENGVATGSVRYGDTELLGLKTRKLNRIRGAKISMIFQEPMTSLDPLYTIGHQLAEPLRHHAGMSGRAARARALELLKLVRIPNPEGRLGSYPHELSGGQRQRVMIAMALANDPDVLIADEPTTALDVTTQARILNLIGDLQIRLGMAVIFITHDLGIVRRISDRVCVMKEGKIVEMAATPSLFETPAHAYTRMLLDAEPEGFKLPVSADAPILLGGDDISVNFNIGGGFLKEPQVLTAVDHVSLALREGQTLGLVGESGSGKSTLGRALLRLLPASGAIRFEGADLGKLRRRDLRRLRRDMQLVFQDPFGSLSPRMTVGEVVAEGLLVHEPSLSARERDARACAALEEVALDPASRNRYPHEFSGGQRQRIAIARAMVLKPKLVVLDEPTSALDRTIQKQIVTLLRDLQKAHDLTYLFISHDLAVVRAMADEVMVMKAGKIIEQGTPDAIFKHPREPYTRELIAAAGLGA